MSKIVIGLPCVGDFPLECLGDLMVSVAEAAMLEDLHIIEPKAIFPHDRAREIIITQALSAKCDYLWFIDADTRQPRGALKEMLRILNEEKAAMVSGYYIQRGFPFASTWAIERKIGDVKIADTMQIVPDDTDRVRIDGCGLGCALIDLNWIRDNLLAPYFLMTPAPDKPTKYMWEDAFFCVQIQKAKGKIFGLPNIVCMHMSERRAITPDNAEVLRKEFVESECV